MWCDATKTKKWLLKLSSCFCPSKTRTNESRRKGLLLLHAIYYLDQLWSFSKTNDNIISVSSLCVCYQDMWSLFLILSSRRLLDWQTVWLLFSPTFHLSHIKPPVNLLLSKFNHHHTTPLCWMTQRMLRRKCPVHSVSNSSASGGSTSARSLASTSAGSDSEDVPNNSNRHHRNHHQRNNHHNHRSHHHSNHHGNQRSAGGNQGKVQLSPSPATPPLMDDIVEEKIYLTLKAGENLGCSVVRGPPSYPGIFVQDVKKDGVAESAGLEVGDQIVGMNGFSFYPGHYNFDDAISKIKACSQMTLTVRKRVGITFFPHFANNSSNHHNNRQRHLNHNNKQHQHKVRAVVHSPPSSDGPSQMCDVTSFHLPPPTSEHRRHHRSRGRGHSACHSPSSTSDCDSEYESYDPEKDFDLGLGDTTTSDRRMNSGNNAITSRPRCKVHGSRSRSQHRESTATLSPEEIAVLQQQLEEEKRRLVIDQRKLQEEMQRLAIERYDTVTRQRCFVLPRYEDAGGGFPNSINTINQAVLIEKEVSDDDSDQKLKSFLFLILLCKLSLLSILILFWCFLVLLSPTSMPSWHSLHWTFAQTAPSRIFPALINSISGTPSFSSLLSFSFLKSPSPLSFFFSFPIYFILSYNYSWIHHHHHNHHHHKSAYIHNSQKATWIIKERKSWILLWRRHRIIIIGWNFLLFLLLWQFVHYGRWRRGKFNTNHHVTYNNSNDKESFCYKCCCCWCWKYKWRSHVWKLHSLLVFLFSWVDQ